MNAFVYQWTNILNNMKYIGSHIGNVDDGYIGSGKYFRNAYDKNPGAFRRDILETIEISDKNQIIKLEEYYLKKVDAANNPEYYNLTNLYYGGDTFSNRTKEDQHRSILKSKTGMEKHKSENPELWNNIYQKMSKTKRLNAALIYQFDVHGNLIKIHDCLEEATEITGISKGNIHSVLNGKRNIAGGFRWSYSYFPNDIIKGKVGRPLGSKNSNKIKRNHVNKHMVQVIQKSLDGSIVNIWDCANDAASSLNLSKGMIQHFMHGRSKKDNYAGFIWEIGNRIVKTYIKTK